MILCVYKSYFNVSCFTINNTCWEAEEKTVTIKTPVPRGN